MTRLGVTIVLVASLTAAQHESRGNVALPPRIDDKTIEIRVSLFVDYIGSINIRTMDYRLDYYLTEAWDVHASTW